MQICKICNREFVNLKVLGCHIVKIHKVSVEKYYIENLNNNSKICICGNKTKFLDLSRGFRTYCSVPCSNGEKNKNLNFRKKISLAQKNIPRKKHTTETKLKLSNISKKMWLENRDKMMEIFLKEERRELQSKKSSLSYKNKYISYVNDIRCDSSVEADFVRHCLEKNIKIERFHFNNEKSIKIENRWYVPDFILDKNLIIEVKDFHIWFKKELKNKDEKYLKIKNWAINNNLQYLFWIKNIGFMNLEQVNQYFEENYGRNNSA